MTNTQTDDGQDAIEALRLALETHTPQELMALCEAGDDAALDLVCQALPAIRKRLGLSIGEMLGADLAEALGVALTTTVH